MASVDDAEIDRACEAIVERGTEQHAVAAALSTYLSDLAAAEDAFAHALVKLSDTVARGMGRKPERVTANAPAAPAAAGESTMSAAIGALERQGKLQAAALAEHSKALRAEASKLHRLDIDANRRGRATQARASELRTREAKANESTEAARTAYRELCAASEPGRGPPPTDPWLAEVALEAQKSTLARVRTERARGLRRLLLEQAAADVVLTDALGSVLVDVVSAHWHLHEELRQRAGDAIKAAKAVDGELDLHTRVRARLPEGDASGLLRPPSHPGSGAATPPKGGRKGHAFQPPALPPTDPADPAGSDPAAAAPRSLLATSQRNMAQVEKVGLLARQSTSVFGGWQDLLGVLTRSGFLHLFTSTEDTQPLDSISLAPHPARGESAASVQLRTGSRALLELSKEKMVEGFFYSSQAQVKWVLRADGPAEAEAWVAAIRAHSGARAHAHTPRTGHGAHDGGAGAGGLAAPLAAVPRAAAEPPAMADVDRRAARQNGGGAAERRPAPSSHAGVHAQAPASPPPKCASHCAHTPHTGTGSGSALARAQQRTPSSARSVRPIAVVEDDADYDE